jgi:hypothetical protein
MGQADIGDSGGYPFIHPWGFKQGTTGKVLKLNSAAGAFFDFGNEIFTNFGMGSRRREKIGEFKLNNIG